MTAGFLFFTSGESLSRLHKCLVVLLLLLISSLWVQGSQQEFREEPTSISTIEGASIILPCSVENKAGILQWTKDGFGLGTDRQLSGFPRYSMIGNNEDGNYSLLITDVKLEDDAVFQCQVGAGVGMKRIRSKDAKVTVLVPPSPPKIIHAPFLQTTTGVKVNLICESRGGKPAAKLKWLDSKNNEIKNGVVYTPEALSDSKLHNAKLTWTLSPTRNHDGKNFTCKAENPALEVPLTSSILLEVRYPPEITLTVDSSKITVYDRVKFTCSAVGNPSDMVYKWYRNDEVITGNSPTTLIIPSITKDYHNNAISCEVINRVGTSKKTHTLNVHYGPRFRTPPANIPADPETDVTLKCDVEGNPEPNILWTLEGSKKIISRQPELTLTNLDSDKAGRYKCTASVPEFQPLVGFYRVLLKGPPEIIAQKDQFGVEGESVNIECLIISVPQPTRVIWIHNDKEIDVERNARFEMNQDLTEDGVKNILTIREANDDDFGSYNCTVWNDFGQDIMEIVLHKQRSLLLMIILAAVLGGIAIIVSVTIVIVLCIRRFNKIPEDQEPEKQSKTSDQSSNDSDLKVEIRTSSSMSNNGSEPWDENSEDAKQQRNGGHEVFRYSGDYCESNFPPKVEAHNNNGYIPYVNYQRDYNPPPVTGAQSPTFGSQPISNGIDPRYQASYANPYLRTNTTNLPPPPQSTFAAGRAVPAGQVPRQPPHTQYITSPQAPVKPGTLATHV